jgi:hypothetical protein
MTETDDQSNHPSVAFGLWRERRDEIGDGVAYQRRMRAEWRRDSVCSFSQNSPARF